MLPLTGFVDNVVQLLLLLLFENKEFANPTAVGRPSALLAAGTLPSLPAPKPAAVSRVVVSAVVVAVVVVVVGDIQSSSQIFTATSMDTPPDPLVLLDDE